jgi:hypothetical protein
MSQNKRAPTPTNDPRGRRESLNIWQCMDQDGVNFPKPKTMEYNYTIVAPQ